MNNDALVAALGPDTVPAVHGYRLAVLAEAERRGLALVSEPLSGVMTLSAGRCVVVDPVDIRLAFRATPGLPVGGRAMRWCPAQGWRCTGPTITSRAELPTAHLSGGSPKCH